MRFMNIDIETYSSNDISKCGAYKYTEAEDFEILIIAYSIDGGAISAIDMTKVDNEPFHADFETFKIALFDPAVKSMHSMLISKELVLLNILINRCHLKNGFAQWLIQCVLAYLLRLIKLEKF